MARLDNAAIAISRYLVLVALVLLSLLETASSQSALSAAPECYEPANYAELVYQSYGRVSSMCCPFYTAYQRALDCVAAQTGSVFQVFTAFYDPLPYCGLLKPQGCTFTDSQQQSLITAHLSKCSSLQLAKDWNANLNCTGYWSAYDIFSSVCTNADIVNFIPGLTCNSYISSYSRPAAQATLAPTSNTTSASTNPSIPSATSNAPVVSSSGAVDKQDSSLGTGAIAGVAVGAAAGGIIIFVCVAFFIWRHRKQKKRTRQVEHTEIVEQEKAQLHSDEYQPKREEMQGSIVPKRIRTVGGLTELEYLPYDRTWSEMPVNEAVGAELRDSVSPTTDSSTLVTSSSRGEWRR